MVAQPDPLVTHSHGGTTFHGPKGVALYRAILLKHALSIYLRTGMIPNRNWTVSNMRSAVTDYTHETYPRSRRGIQRALEGIEKFLSDFEQGAVDMPALGERAPAS